MNNLEKILDNGIKEGKSIQEIAREIRKARAKYKCTKDFQYGNWQVGEIMTAKEWREEAIEWAEHDNMEGTAKELKHLETDEEIIDYIAELWQIEILKVGEQNEY